MMFYILLGICLIVLGFIISYVLYQKWWTPDMIPTSCWYDASDEDTIVVDQDLGKFVSQWDDKSGNGNHLIQPTAVHQPSLHKEYNKPNKIVFNKHHHLVVEKNGINPLGIGNRKVFVAGCFKNNESTSEIYEIVIPHDSITLDTRLLINGYLAHKHRTQDTLPDDHPYKHKAPRISLRSYIKMWLYKIKRFYIFQM